VSLTNQHSGWYSYQHSQPYLPQSC